MDKIQDKIDNFLFALENFDVKEYEKSIGEICDIITKNPGVLQSHTQSIIQLVMTRAFKSKFENLMIDMIRKESRSVVYFLEFYLKVSSSDSSYKFFAYRSLATLYPIALRLFSENLVDSDTIFQIISKINNFFAERFPTETDSSSSLQASIISVCLRMFLCYTEQNSSYIFSFDVFDTLRIKSMQFFFESTKIEDLRDFAFSTMKSIALLNNLSYIVLLNIINAIKILALCRPFHVRDISNILEVIVVTNYTNPKAGHTSVLLKFKKKLMGLILTINRDSHIHSRLVYMMLNHLKFPISEIERFSKIYDGVQKRKRSANESDTPSKKVDVEKFTDHELKILTPCLVNSDKAVEAAIELNKIYLAKILTPQKVSDILMNVIYSLPQTIPTNLLDIYTIYMSKKNIDVYQDVLETISNNLSKKNIGYGPDLVQKFLKMHMSLKKKEQEDPKEVKILSYNFISEAIDRLFDFIDSYSFHDLSINLVENSISYILLFDFSTCLKKFEEKILINIEKYFDLISKILYKSSILSFDDLKYREYYNKIFDAVFDQHLTMLNNINPSLIKIITEAPYYPPEAYDKIKKSCLNLDTFSFGFQVLETLVLSYNLSASYIDLALELTINYSKPIRDSSIQLVLFCYKEKIYMENIHNFLRDVIMLRLYGSNHISDTENNNYNEFLVRIDVIFHFFTENHLYLLVFIHMIIGIDPKKFDLIMESLENTKLEIFYESEGFYDCLNEMTIENKTFVIKFCEIIDKKKNFSQTLVDHLKSIYEKNKDPYILSLIFKYLPKEDIIKEIPPILSENENLIKYFFLKLMNTWLANHDTSISPVDLLILLHRYEDTIDLRILTRAITICVNFREIYSQETLAIVLQNLIEFNPIPTLTMRMMIQSLGLCPKLGGFIMGLMQKLIHKHIWKHPKLWKGFVKCCEKTKPQCLPIILQLPIRNLEDCLNISPELHQALKTHVKQMSINQQSLVQKSVLQVVDKDISTKQLIIDFD